MTTNVNEAIGKLWKLKNILPRLALMAICKPFDWDGLGDLLRDVPWKDIFKLSASAAASEFCERVQVGIDVYIPHHKYQVKPHSSPWFSAAFAAAIVHSLLKNYINFILILY